MSQYVAIVKLDYVPLTGDDEEVVPGNIGALKKGLEALLSEDARDNTRARELWEEAKTLLAEESEDDTGVAALGSIQVADDFMMQDMSYGG